ncbi:uncharacterized protein [Coffea arabica]|uniref:Uncharacterized protein LOC113724905 n=1 Tax=Coffea arabica TaxID=13443 RepID=A0A6P6VKK4_COFAR|nr:uncharacterized protein LOC113724905 [Coffea arabica]XP_027103595.1 uncharacterized protein LOC113724905 [Coffea arabica]XP_027103596.1 uncharacterized protein LOC113724905 [Coffea arabica]
MECNKDEALRAKTIAEGKLENKDFTGAKKFALKAQSLYPGLDGLSQMLTTIDVYISAENKISGEVDWYGVLGVNPSADDETVRKQYRKLALLLHPDKNRSVGADGAFKLLCEAWSLLSDKSKRLAYNMRRSPKGFQQKVPTQASGPSEPPRSNGYHNHSGRTTSAPKTQNTRRTDTFWTICHRCKMHYEYLKQYLNHTLLCPNCHEAFYASETAPPFNYSKSSNLASRHRHQNSSNHAAPSNLSDPRRNATASAKDSGPGPAGLQSPTYTANSPQDRFSRTGSVGSTDPSIAAKAANVIQQAQERMKRERDASQAAAAGWDGNSSYNSAFDGERVYKKTRLDDDGYCYGANTAYHRTTVNGGSSFAGTSAPRKAGFEHDKVHGFSFAYSKPNCMRELTPVENRNMLMAKARKEILKKLTEWRSQNASKAVQTEKMKVTDTKKEKERNSRNDHGRDLSGSGESSATRLADHAEKSAGTPTAGDVDEEHVVAEAMNVPDPDFHDFDQDRAESSFGENEVWAAYDDDDGMPRFYAMVNKVISRNPFKLRISWLNSKTSNEFGKMDWIGSGFYKTCGEFRLGRYEINKSINSFSHKVKWSKVRGVVHIFPKKGEVWALYKNWSPDWNEDTAEELIHKYDMMVVLVDYDEERGVSVAPLVKVAGFKTVFLPNLEPEKVMKIPKEEMFRFSHQVPNYQLTGKEAQNAPEGCLELDPAATPLDLLQVITDDSEVQKQVMQNVPGTRADEIADRASEAEKEEKVEIGEAVKKEE